MPRLAGELAEGKYVRLETIHPDDLGPAQLERWRAHQHARPELASPYLTPEWMRIVADVRDDARICVIDEGDGFLAVQRLSPFAAMGLGAPIADYQGVVSATPLRIDARALCRSIKVGRIDLTHVPDGATPLKAGGTEGSWIAGTHCARDLYEAALKQRRAEFVRQTDKKARKLAREKGHVEFRGPSTDRRDFDALLAWKNAQLVRSGQPAIWTAPWVSEVLERCFDTKTPAFAGALFTLRAGNQLAAAAFCLRSARVLHFWIVAHDSAFDAYSPGVQLARWIVGWAAENGIAEVDFGPGDYQYKRQLSTGQRMLSYGVVGGASVSSVVRQTQYALRGGIERLPQPRLAALPGKAMRRLDLMRALG
ncbi:MAG: GNAT family N-acetyltransferase [Hyphomonadaceae bacterium]|nr:GNAT family N-acetyltransferase [Hyphomonadaceae bacterium]